MTTVPDITLNDGHAIPVVAFGTGTALYAKECADLVLQALEAGYTSLDGAQIYANSQSIGDALARWGGKRDDVYVLTKWGKREAGGPRAVLLDELEKLGVEYVDMYLIHSPLVPEDRQKAWAEMEAIKKDGLALSVGVSNFREEDIIEISKTWEHAPAVNQIEYNPYNFHAPNMLRLLALMKEHKIKVQCYGPLNSVHRVPGGPVDSVVDKIARERGSTPAQVLLLWAAQYGGGTVVTTSRNTQRQAEQLAAFSQRPLSAQEVEAIAEAGRGKFHRQFMKEVWDAARE
ncbi:Aldo/keto reductase [Cutaneotrichosporon oleaginosum]|uniref:Aldo/keto reductase n=1 Tax=Cutaneotrichosporon oleaginosum TaxID=879819 RepID=A0A0J0XYC1_9TREE|nr:Aldo/keto reductase [Cutaneotrichosporon oleaginosum]KLT46043.1 Aldo/keto reductase [Cutaneotrichosporon oleaginosum]